jgi:sporulation protein YlmC with PRC-barrel domain
MLTRLKISFGYAPRLEEEDIIWLTQNAVGEDRSSWREPAAIERRQGGSAKTARLKPQHAITGNMDQPSVVRVFLHNSHHGGNYGSSNRSSQSKLISSNDVQGTEVYGAEGNNVGEIDHLIIDKQSGRVAYAVMSFGGFMGLGHSHYPIPWSALTYDKSLGGFRTAITEKMLKDAPEFSDDSWQDRDWETKTHQYYRSQPYWEMRGGM